MLHRALFPTLALTFAVVSTSVAAPISRSLAKWPPWISIESPVNPFDNSARGAAFLIHAMVREGTPTVSDVIVTAEGLVGGVRKTVAIHIDTTSRPAVFAVRKQWPTDGTWLLRVSLFSTTAIVTLDKAGNVLRTSIPTVAQSGMQIPRTVAPREIDALLADAAKR
ncbi:MAG: hypothetical protein JWM41_3068 [Gemmatimonadetes bacterium]|nr:hypothetical protein [Gemmatimonadota bacterium]